MSAYPIHVALIAAAMRRCGREGFQATSTRAIAAEAGTNISSIADPFGSKAGLRLACADAVAERFGRVTRPLPGDAAMLTPAQARAELRRLLANLDAALEATHG